MQKQRPSLSVEMILVINEDNSQFVRKEVMPTLGLLKTCKSFIHFGEIHEEENLNVYSVVRVNFQMTTEA